MKQYVLSFILFAFCAFSCRDASNGASRDEITVVLDEVAPDSSLVNFWTEFSRRFNSVDTAYVGELALDTVWLWGERVGKRDFIKRYRDGYSQSGISRVILDSQKITYSSISCRPFPIVKEAVRRGIHGAYDCKQVILLDTIGSKIVAIEFDLLNTKGGYRIFGIERYNYSEHVK